MGTDWGLHGVGPRCLEVACKRRLKSAVGGVLVQECGTIHYPECTPPLVVSLAWFWLLSAVWELAS